jgi:hypothetical protein
MLKSYSSPQPTPQNAPCDAKASQVRPVRDRQKVCRMRESNRENSLKMTERRANLYENKGSVFHRLRRSGNVIENKASYSFNTGMLMKTKEVDGRWERAGFGLGKC